MPVSLKIIFLLLKIQHISLRKSAFNLLVPLANQLAHSKWHLLTAYIFAYFLILPKLQTEGKRRYPR
jgi:hypothetical protein